MAVNLVIRIDLQITKTVSFYQKQTGRHTDRRFCEEAILTNT